MPTTRTAMKVVGKTKVFVFDYDGTLVNSTMLGFDPKKPLTEEEKVVCNKLDAIYLQLFDQLSAIGHVYLITNANMQWFLATIPRFPRLQKWFKRKDNQTRVISARDRYAIEHKNHVLWKRYTFQDVLQKHTDHKELVCFSDAQHDLDNCSEATNQRVKNYALAERSSLESLVTQWRDIIAHMTDAYQL